MLVNPELPQNTGIGYDRFGTKYRQASKEAYKEI